VQVQQGAGEIVQGHAHAAEVIAQLAKNGF
jgi:hypothetical protein